MNRAVSLSPPCIYYLPAHAKCGFQIRKQSGRSFHLFRFPHARSERQRALVSWSSSLLLDVRFLSSSNIFLKFRWSRPHFKIRGRFLCALLTRGV